MFLAFSPEADKSSLLSLNWQVLKVVIVKFQASTLDQCHHLLINLSCKSASKPLNATSARSAACFFQPIVQLSKKSSRSTLRLRFWCCIYTLRMYIRLPDQWKFFQGQFVFQRETVSDFHGLPQGKPVATGGEFRGNAYKIFVPPQILLCP